MPNSNNIEFHAHCFPHWTWSTATKFNTCHDSTAVVACAKFWCNLTARKWITTKHHLHWNRNCEWKIVSKIFQRVTNTICRNKDSSRALVEYQVRQCPWKLFQHNILKMEISPGEKRQFPCCPLFNICYRCNKIPILNPIQLLVYK